MILGQRDLSLRMQSVEHRLEIWSCGFVRGLRFAIHIIEGIILWYRTWTNEYSERKSWQSRVVYIIFSRAPSRVLFNIQVVLASLDSVFRSHISTIRTFQLSNIRLLLHVSPAQPFVPKRAKLRANKHSFYLSPADPIRGTLADNHNLDNDERNCPDSLTGLDL